MLSYEHWKVLLQAAVKKAVWKALLGRISWGKGAWKSLEENKDFKNGDGEEYQAEGNYIVFYRKIFSYSLDNGHAC